MLQFKAESPIAAWSHVTKLEKQAVQIKFSHNSVSASVCSLVAKSFNHDKSKISFGPAKGLLLVFRAF
jgi:hypothetical protein